MLTRAGVAGVVVALFAIAVAAGQLLRAQQPLQASQPFQASQGPQDPPPQFRADVEYVEVDARVLDSKGQPIRDCTQKDFTVVEDGVRQMLSNFSVVDVPVVTATGAVTAAGVKPDVASNTRESANRRTYLIMIDDGGIELARTVIVRAFLRRFIERSIGPDDLVGIATIGRGAASENFTNDKPRLIAAVNRIVGYSPGSPTLQNLQSFAERAPVIPTAASRTPTGIGFAPRRIDPQREAEIRDAQRRLAETIHALSASGPGSKAIIYVSEGIPFEMITNTEGLMLVGDVQRLSVEARRGNVPIYPVDPRGLSAGFESAVEVPAIRPETADPGVSFLNETRRAQDGLRAIADDTGGLPIVGVNDIDGGIDRIVGSSSFYYVLGYYSTNSRRDGKYRKINVTIDRPGARVLNRRGYTAVVNGPRKGPSLAGPPHSSNELREALNAVLPATGIPLAMTAAAFQQMKGRASVAVVLETSGSDLAWQNGRLVWPAEMTVIAMEKGGAIKAGDVNNLQLSSQSDTADRVRQFGFRWLARLDDLQPGRYQIRAAAANGPAKQGSVWYDIEIPDFSKSPLTMSDVTLASAIAVQRPTLRPDTLLADALPAPPTTLREFLADDVLAVYAEVYDNQLDRPHDVETTVVVTNERGEITFRILETLTSRQLGDLRGVVRVKARIPIANIAPGNYTLTVDARQAGNRAISAGRAVPFQVVTGGNK